MNVRRVFSVSMAIGLFTLMVTGQSLSVIEESLPSARGQEPVSAMIIKRCEAVSAQAAKASKRFADGREKLQKVMMVSELQASKFQKEMPLDKEKVGRMNFILLFATVQSNKCRQYAGSAQTLGKDVAAALRRHGGVAEADIAALERRSGELRQLADGIDTLAAEMEEALAHPERPFRKSKE